MRAAAAALAALLLAAGASRAQEPDDPPETDPDVEQAQFTEPPPAGVAPPGRAVADPPAPTVRVQVRVPALLARGAPVKYTIIVSNTSTATAYKVRVRHPVPANVTGPATFDPSPEGPTPPPGAPPKEAAWAFAELKPGRSHTITAEYPVKPDALSLRAEAFVSFEHGQAVETAIEKPRLAVQKRAPAESVAGDPIPVEIVVTNPGPVPVADVILTESFPAGAQFTGDGATPGAAPGQKVWKLGTLRPGERKLVRYRLTAKDGGEVGTSSAATAAGVPKPVPEESVTKVLVPKLTVALTGPDKADAANPAEYTLTATNAGTLPLPAVRVAARVPDGCEPAAMSVGGRVDRNEITWVGPPDRQTAGPLKPGEKFEVKFKLRSARPGERVVHATADGGRGADGSADTKTTFSGGPVLRGTADIAPGRTEVGAQGVITYTVTNQGDDAAQDVRLVVVIPPEVSVVEVTPKPRQAKGEVAFEPTGLPVNGSVKYTLTYRGEKPDTARFTFRLSAAGQDRPTESTKEVAIIKPREGR